MTPVRFTCRRFIPYPATALCAWIADTDLWGTFRGYGPLPGVRRATYALRTEHMVGSRIMVENTDGSRHTEVIYRWIPGEAVAMRLEDFTLPVSTLATHFTEEWTLRTAADGTQAERVFSLYPRTVLTRPVLWLVSLVLRRAVDQHLKQMADTLSA